VDHRIRASRRRPNRVRRLALSRIGDSLTRWSREASSGAESRLPHGRRRLGAARGTSGADVGFANRREGNTPEARRRSRRTNEDARFGAAMSEGTAFAIRSLMHAVSDPDGRLQRAGTGFSAARRGECP
jgi:hypothetical protein